MLDFGKLGGGGNGGEKILEPRKIFTTLARRPRFRRPSDEQGEVLDRWFAARSGRDCTLKMNTGSGKTLVGLLALQSSLNEGIAPAVYVVPDNYLVEQVVAEAGDLGIKTTIHESDADFLQGRAILVTNIFKLVNGRSVFGVGSGGVRIQIGAIVIDDAHACLQTVSDQFKIRCKAGGPVYDGLLKVFEGDLKEQSDVGLLDLQASDPQALMLVPFWAWQDKRNKVISLLHANRESDELGFQWPLLKEVVPLCQCAFGGQELEIAPRIIPIDEIPSITAAQRRIYMTATLADDGILISHFGADATAAASPIKPRGAGDIGDRMILVPQEINPQIKTSDIRDLAAEIARTYNVAVIVPSALQAEFWRGVSGQVLDKTNIADGIRKLKTGVHVGLTVLLNRYDGIDLPDNACRLLVLHGVPQVYGLIERVEMTALEGTEQQLLKQVQKLEQGMGRGVRSSEDYCAVLLIGSRLTQRLHDPRARSKFTPATLAQLDLGRDVTNQVRGKPLSDLRPLLDYCLTKNPDWWKQGRERLAKAPEGAPSFVDPAISNLRAAFEHARRRQFEKACEEVQKALNATSEKAVKGYLKQQLAEYWHQIDPAKAQEILLSALQDNPRVLKPIGGIAYSKLTAPAAGQAAAARAMMGERFLDGNDLVIFVNALIGDLTWDPERTKQFEAAIRDLGSLLGFGSQRPELEVGKGPDNLWAVGDLRFFVIECKSGSSGSGHTISKTDCNQLLGSTQWFRDAYDSSCVPTPIIIHPDKVFGRDASPSTDIRVIDTFKLGEFKLGVRKFATAIARSNGFKDEKVIAQQLAFFGLTARDFIDRFTSAFTVQR